MYVVVEVRTYDGSFVPRVDFLLSGQPWRRIAHTRHHPGHPHHPTRQNRLMRSKQVLLVPITRRINAMLLEQFLHT